MRSNSLVGLCFILLLWQPKLFADELLFVMTDNCPYTCVKSKANPGLLVEAAQMIFKPIGFTVIHSYVSTRVFHQSLDGSVYDGVLAISKRQKQGLIYPSAPFIQPRNGIYVAKDNNWRFTTIADLDAVKLGVVRGKQYGTDVDAYIIANKHNRRIQRLNAHAKPQDFINALQTGKITAFVYDQYAMQYYETQHGELPIMLAGSLPATPLTMAFFDNAMGKDLAAVVDDAMQVFLRSKQWQQLKQKYAIVDGGNAQ